MTILEILQHKVQIPTDTVLGKNKYVRLVQKVTKYLKDKGYKSKQTTPYTLDVVAENNETITLGLQNLERRVYKLSEDKWDSYIDDFISMFYKRIDISKLLVKDKKAFLEKLRIRLYRYDQDNSFWNRSAYYDILPGIRGVVSFDADKYVMSVDKALLQEAGLITDEIIEVAKKMTIKNSKIKDKASAQFNRNITLYTGDDYFALNINKLFKNADKERYGKIFGIPCKNVITSIDITDTLINDLDQYINLGIRLYMNELGPITTDLFWSYRGKIYILGVDVSEKQVVFEPAPLFIDKVINSLFS